MSKFILAFLFAGKAIPWNIYSLEKISRGIDSRTEEPW
jgi:hypothetical protein